MAEGNDIDKKMWIVLGVSVVTALAVGTFVTGPIYEKHKLKKAKEKGEKKPVAKKIA